MLCLPAVPAQIGGDGKASKSGVNAKVPTSYLLLPSDSKGLVVSFLINNNISYLQPLIKLIDTFINAPTPADDLHACHGDRRRGAQSVLAKDCQSVHSGEDLIKKSCGNAAVRSATHNKSLAGGQKGRIKYMVTCAADKSKWPVMLTINHPFLRPQQ